MLCQGALEELLAVCDSIMENGTVTRLDAARRAAITELGLRLNDEVSAGPDAIAQNLGPTLPQGPLLL